jgi:hypothetical protein
MNRLNWETREGVEEVARAPHALVRYLLDLRILLTASLLIVLWMSYDSAGRRELLSPPESDALNTMLGHWLPELSSLAVKSSILFQDTDRDAYMVSFSTQPAENGSLLVPKDLVDECRSRLIENGWVDSGSVEGGYARTRRRGDREAMELLRLTSLDSGTILLAFREIDDFSNEKSRTGQDVMDADPWSRRQLWPMFEEFAAKSRESR